MNIDPDMLKIKTKYDEIKDIKYKTEEHDHEKILKSPRIDIENYKKEYDFQMKKK